jgi:hypothetical protein
MGSGPRRSHKLVSDNLFAKPLPLEEGIRGYLLGLRASRYSPKTLERAEMVLRELAHFASSQEDLRAVRDFIRFIQSQRRKGEG